MSDKPFLLRLPVELKDELTVYAKAERRSVNNFITMVLADYIHDKKVANNEPSR